MATIRPLIALALLIFANPVRATDNGASLEGLLAAAKYAGFCGA